MDELGGCPIEGRSEVAHPRTLRRTHCTGSTDSRTAYWKPVSPNHADFLHPDSSQHLPCSLHLPNLQGTSPSEKSWGRTSGQRDYASEFVWPSLDCIKNCHCHMEPCLPSHGQTLHLGHDFGANWPPWGNVHFSLHTVSCCAHHGST